MPSAPASLVLCVAAWLGGCDRAAGDRTPAPALGAPKTRTALVGYASYDESADGRRLLDDALARARPRGKRVLAMFGGNWCVWCRALDKLFTEDDAIARSLDDNFVLVHLDSGSNEALNTELGDPFRHGFPVLVVFGDDGKPLHVQETGSLEAADKSVAHDKAKVLGFLSTWAGTRSVCPPGRFFVHGGCHTADDVGIAGPAQH